MQSRDSVDEQRLKRVKNSNAPEACLQFESEVEVQRSVPSLPFQLSEFPFHAKYGAPASRGWLLPSLNFIFTCPCNGKSGGMYPSSTMPSAACTNEVLLHKDEKLKTSAIKKDVFFTYLPTSSYSQPDTLVLPQSPSCWSYL